MGKGRYIILIGNYGSGKTEIALNIAIRAAARGERTQVIDLDKVNDYFRMSDRVELLEQNKIDVVSPTFAGKGLTPSNMSAAVPRPSRRTGISSCSTSAATRRVQCRSGGITAILPRWSRSSLRCGTL